MVPMNAWFRNKTASDITGATGRGGGARAERIQSSRKRFSLFGGWNRFGIRVKSCSTKQPTRTRNAGEPTKTVQIEGSRSDYQHHNDDPSMQEWEEPLNDLSTRSAGVTLTTTATPPQSRFQQVQPSRDSPPQPPCRPPSPAGLPPLLPPAPAIAAPKKKKKKKQQETSLLQDIHEILENCRLTREFMRRYNAHDLVGAREMLTDDYYTIFRDHEMTWDDLKGETQKIFDAFPDYKFAFERMEARSDGVVILHNFVPSGTHTGKPYGFGPCPEIPPSGTFVQNDPEEVHFYFRKGKICQNAVYTDGEFVGPVGIYTQIGGFPFA